ncbi:hypothetical protein V4U86_25180 [Mycobacterium sp. AMU20-3851]|uniref:hypothetical protein n=1 Tax=Mycobacterium sp. AMU20-3851 TaxID=3122055 RepID=UPI003754FBC3
MRHLVDGLLRGLATKLTELGEWAKTQKSIEPTTELPDYTQFLDNQFLEKPAS